MIHIIIDYSNIFNDPKTLIINDNQSYLHVYSILDKLNIQQDEISIVIKRKLYWNWIERFINRLEESYYSIEIASLKSLLQTKWSCSIPKEVTDDIIKECKFLDSVELPTFGESFDDFVLRVSYGNVFFKKTITLEDIPILLAQSFSENWINSQKLLFLKSLLDHRIDLWKSNADNNIHFLLSKFKKSPSLLYTELISYAILKSYKIIGLRSLPDFPVYDSMSLPLDKLIFDDKDVSGIINQIEYEINSWEIPNNIISLKDFISKLSGRLELEYYKVEELIEKKPELLNKYLIILIKEKFRLLSNVNENIELLEKRIPPPFPSVPFSEWSQQQMLDWVVNEYFPYYEWALYSSRNFNILEPLSVIFSDWYYRNFENIKYNSGNMLFNFIPNNFEKFVDENQLDVILIIDNLPWFFSKIVTDALSNNGYNLGSSTPYFTHIPTLTEFCKKCLVSGMPNYTEITDPSYKQILEKGGWYQFKEQLKLKYYPTIGAFYNEKKLEGGTHLINYLQLDDLLHKSEEELGVSHFQAACDTINTLVKKFIKHINTLRKDKPVRLHIISDHGATFLVPSKDGLLPKEFIKSKGLQDFSIRYAVLLGDPNYLLTPDLVSNTYLIRKEKFGVPNHFLLARGFKSLIPLNGNRMSHGGLQPEEVIIPHMVFEKVNEELQNPTVTLSNSKFRYSIQTIIMGIGNPNMEDLSEIYIMILNSNFESEKTTINFDILFSKTQKTVEFTGKFKQTDNQFEKENLKLGIRYHVKGIQYNYEIIIPIVIISIVDTDDLGIFDKF